MKATNYPTNFRNYLDQWRYLCV